MIPSEKTRAITVPIWMTDDKKNEILFKNRDVYIVIVACSIFSLSNRASINMNHRCSECQSRWRYTPIPFKHRIYFHDGKMRVL